MGALETLEKKLDKALVKDAPWQIPENARVWIANYAWAFSLVGLVVGVFAVLGLTAILFVTTVVVNTNPYGIVVPETVAVHHALFAAWIALAVLAAYLLVLAISIPKLKRKEKRGWDLTFYAALFFLVYDIFNWIQYPSAVFSLLGNLIGALLGFYILFQVRSKFMGNKSESKAPTSVSKN